LAGVFTVDQNERAVKDRFGRAKRLGTATTLDDPIAKTVKVEARQRYCYTQVPIIHPGGPYFKWPWERIHKGNIATQTMNMACDPETPREFPFAIVDAVTKDQVVTGLKGQIRDRISEINLYAYLFGVNRPVTHGMGYFVSILRERIANAEMMGKRIALFQAEAVACGHRYDPLQVVVARDMCVVDKEREREAWIERNNRTHARTLSVSLSPDRTGGSHILACAHMEEQQRDSSLIGSHDKILAKPQTLSAAGVEYVMLNAAASRARSGCR
jgi:hypothetical protein